MIKFPTEDSIMNDQHVIERLAAAYERIHVPADQLPYTDEFEFLYEEIVVEPGLVMSRSEFWRFLASVRKRGKLPRLVR